MKLCLFILFIHFLTHGHSNSDINIGYRVTLAVPMEYSLGFIGRAFIMETDQMAPKFKVALNVEAVEEKYSCSIDVLLGDVRVWSSGHLSRFYATEKCVLELTQGGDLQLKGQKEQVGWRSGTSGQGVQRLNLLRTGNLVLVDDLNMIKWQSFNFPTNIMLWGQRLNAHSLDFFPPTQAIHHFPLKSRTIRLRST
ncbi:Epidermis-specific secreted glycoprotein EP1 [Camellia lanceoleosa]|uniref:Epidermis-specific secreted glycoprotein EP1 n=1 Tax=Camellia lanceoleosa TaxID=1840588 RepID=A0ACC0HPJ2_9ERIC|nr:Epidermis-specific secreted glycoprotein EP1 [Camellia lanceoleosa]